MMGQFLTHQEQRKSGGDAVLTMTRLMMTAIAALVLNLAVTGRAQSNDYYKGKSVTLVVPNSPSGPMTQYARMLAPFVQEKLGARLVRVSNQPGAGGLKGANGLWRAEPDGLTIGFTNISALVLAQLAQSPGVQFNAREFTYLGRAASEPRILTVGGKSKIHSLDDVLKLGRPFAFASQGTDEDFYTMAILADAFGFKLRIVTGYEGNSDTALSVIRGDTDGHITSVIASKAAIDAGDKRVILAITRERLHEFASVRTALELISDQAKRQTIQAVTRVLGMGRGFFGPPHMKTEAVQQMRTAIAETFKDEKLFAEAKKRRLDINFASGEQSQNEINALIAEGDNLTGILKAALKSIQ
jgi:putative tricarboxylic transport membrane protein